MNYGCGKYTRVAGTNGGGMACGSELKHLDGSITVEFCHACDARLAKLVPELFYELQAAVDAWDHIKDDDINGGDCVDWLVQEFLPAARAALAKLTREKTHE